MDDVIKLKPRHKVFADEYLSNGGNATAAARKAGYKDGNSIRSTAKNLLTKPNISAYINEELDKRDLSKEDVLSKLSEQARASLEQFISFNEKGEPYIDLAKGIGKMHLIRKVTISPRYGVTIELVDQQAALMAMGKVHKLFTDYSADVKNTIELGEHLTDMLIRTYGKKDK